MNATAKSSRSSVRANRESGDATKARILDAAGRLFARKGYADTTSKEICEAAQVNITAVNYHFGSREGLYLAVLQEMHHYFSNPDALAELHNSDLTPTQKLESIMDRLTATVYRNQSWQVRLWAREMLAPTACSRQVFCEESKPRFDMLNEILREITGLDKDDPLISFCYFNVMSPFLVLLVLGGGIPTPHRALFDFDTETMSANLKEFVIAGLQAFKKSAHKETDMNTMTEPAT